LNPHVPTGINIIQYKDMQGFDDLNWAEKTALLRKKGQPIITISYAHFVVTLMAVDGSFVERYYNTRTHSLEVLRSATSFDLLKYMDHIVLSEVLQLL
jgi:hypothetical protein